MWLAVAAGWKDGWMEGWMVGWVIGWIDARVGGLIAELTRGWRVRRISPFSAPASVNSSPALVLSAPQAEKEPVCLHN